MTTKNFPVIYMSPTAIKPYYRNAKRHDKRQVTLLAKAIRTVGFDQPIVVDKEHVIIKGHGRRLAALELKIDLVPVVVRSDLSAEEVQASRLADNLTGSKSDIDEGAEKAEVLDFMAKGGVGAETFFDFATATKPKLDFAPAAAGVTEPMSAKTKVVGKLENCPKCGHTFMETK